MDDPRTYCIELDGPRYEPEYSREDYLADMADLAHTSGEDRNTPMFFRENVELEARPANLHGPAGLSRLPKGGE